MVDSEDEALEQTIAHVVLLLVAVVELVVEEHEANDREDIHENDRQHQHLEDIANGLDDRVHRPHQLGILVEDDEEGSIA